jgi:hypothetical protein
MATAELLWTIQEDRRRQAAAIRRERLARAGSAPRAGAMGRLVGWVRGRLRVFRRPTVGQIGWTSSR